MGSLLVMVLLTALAAVNPASADSVLKSCKSSSTIAFKSVSFKTPKVFGNPGATVDPTNPFQFNIPVDVYPSCATKTLTCGPGTCYVFARVTASSDSGGAGGTVRIQAYGRVFIGGIPTPFIEWYDATKAAGCRVGNRFTTDQSCVKDTKKIVLPANTPIRVFCDWKGGAVFSVGDRGTNIKCELWSWTQGGIGG